MLRHGIADGIWHIDGGCSLRYHSLENTAKKVWIRTAGIFGGKLDVSAMLAGKAHCKFGLFVDLLRRHAQLLLHMQGARGEEGVNAPGLRVLERLDAPTDIAVVGATKSGDRRVLDRRGDRLHRLKITV